MSDSTGLLIKELEMEKTRVLIIDDDIEGSQMLREDLEETGIYEVFEENRGLLAMRAVRKHAPDIILLDIMIPDLDGPSIAAQIEEARDLRPRPRIAFLSSIIFPEDAERGMVGNYSYLSKDSPREETKRALAELAI
jgi:two-component system OmpR family response regulator